MADLLVFSKVNIPGDSSCRISRPYKYALANKQVYVSIGALWRVFKEVNYHFAYVLRFKTILAHMDKQFFFYVFQLFIFQIWMFITGKVLI